MKNENLWLKHKADFADHDNVLLLLEEQGLEGYGIYWLLMEKLRNRDALKLPMSVIPTIARMYLTTTEKVEAVINDYDLFDFEDNEFFYSANLLEEVQKLKESKEKRSLAGQKGNKVRWEKESVASESPTDNKATPDQRKEDEKASEKPKDKPKTEDKFSFKDELLKLGVEKQVVGDWMKVRRTKKATDTLTAFNKLKTQINLSGASANDCIIMAVEHNWQGFNAEWYKKEMGGRSGSLFGSYQQTNDANKPLIIDGREYK